MGVLVTFFIAEKQLSAKKKKIAHKNENRTYAWTSTYKLVSDFPEISRSWSQDPLKTNKQKQKSNLSITKFSAIATTQELH